jgi:hypothetical protein
MLLGLSLRAFEISEAEVHSTLTRGVGHCWRVTSRVDALVEGFASECCEVMECGTFACGLVLRLTLPRKQFELDEQGSLNVAHMSAKQRVRPYSKPSTVL